MKKAQHTPKPWIFEHDQEEGTITIWAGSAIEERHTGMYDSAGEMQLYTACYGDCEGDKELIANAHLVAAAPYLLEALELLTAAVEQDVAMFAEQPHKESRLGIARAAIAKARGETELAA